MNTHTYTIAASFTIGLFCGYIINRNWYLLKSILGIKSKRPERKDKNRALNSNATVPPSTLAYNKKNDDAANLGQVEDASEGSVK